MLKQNVRSRFRFNPKSSGSRIAAITPFALPAPGVGAPASALIFGEAFPPMRFGGRAPIVLGLAIIVLPARAAAPPLQAPPA